MTRSCQKTLIGVALLVVTSAVASAQPGVPRFTDYAVTAVYSGPNASVNLTKDDRVFRTRIRAAAKDKPNFAGEYIVAQWGCGAECLTTVIISARTGKVYSVPFSICCWSSDVDAIDFKLNSRLLVFRGMRDESEKDREKDTHYYEFRNGQFRFIRTIKKS